jgi:uncharacterized secreted protein with C-terminal beta-propeller domain
VATDNTELIDAINAETMNEANTNDLSLQQFSSCEEMSSVLTDYIQSLSGYFSRYPIMPYDTVKQIGAMEPSANAVSDELSVEADGTSSKEAGSSTDYSNTNLQIAGVDEPEILKSD